MIYREHVFGLCNEADGRDMSSRAVGACRDIAKSRREDSREGGSEGPGSQEVPGGWLGFPVRLASSRRLRGSIVASGWAFQARSRPTSVRATRLRFYATLRLSLLRFSSSAYPLSFAFPSRAINSPPSRFYVLSHLGYSSRYPRAILFLYVYRYIGA